MGLFCKFMQANPSSLLEALFLTLTICFSKLLTAMTLPLQSVHYRLRWLVWIPPRLHKNRYKCVLRVLESGRAEGVISTIGLIKMVTLFLGSRLVGEPA